MKKILFTSILALVLLAAAGCYAEDAAVKYNSDGMTLSVPAEYNELLEIDVPENDESGTLFSVYEKESIEAAKKQMENWQGAGWLFSIGRVSEERFQEMRCNDASGVKFFAIGDDGVHYVLYHPTDVRMVREDYSAPDVMQGWTVLNEWAAGVPDTFVAENAGLTAESYGNTVLDVYLAKVYYQNDVNYTVSTTEYGPMDGKGFKAGDAIKPLIQNVSYEYISDVEAPDGEYVVLNFPDDDIRFDFFFSSDKPNYIRQVWNNEENEMLYKAVFADNSTNATEVMNNFYHDLVLKNSLGYTPDDMIGVWAEKMAGRCSIEIRKNADGNFDVNIHWSSSAFESSFWKMTAVPTGNGAELRYEDCVETVITFTSETENTEKTVYENGTGTFELLSTYELVWHDEIEHAADDNLFISAGK